MPQFSIGFGLLAPPVILSVLALIGWVLDIPLLTSGLVSGASMNPATAVCFILLGLETSRLAAENNAPFISRAGKWVTWVVIVASAMKLSDGMFGTSFSIDARLFSAKLAANLAQPNRMAPSTAGCFMALGLALLLLRGRLNSILLAQGLAALTLFAIVIVRSRYLYGAEPLYGAGVFMPMGFMAVNTSVSFIFLSGAVLYACPNKGFMRIFASGAPGDQAPTSLHAKILFWFLLVAILPLVIIAFFTYQQARTTIETEIHGFLDVYADKQGQIIENYMAERRADIHVFAEMPILKEALQKLEEAFSKSGAGSTVYLERGKEFQIAAQKIVKSHGYKNLYLVSRNGDVIFEANPEGLSGTNMFSGTMKTRELSHAVRTALETKETKISKIDFYPEFRNKVSIYLAAPIFQGEDVLGVLVLMISPDNIYHVVSNYTGLGETGESVLAIRIGDDVVFAAPTRFDSNASNKIRAKIGASAAMPMQNAVLEQNGSGYSVDYRGQAVWAVWRYLPSLKLGMVVKKDVKEINAETEPIKKFSIFLSLLTFLLVAGIAARVAKTITKPIENLTITTQLIADGNLRERVKIEEQNEIGALADSFNRMAAYLETAYAKIRSVVVNAMDGIITIHDDGRIETVNPAAERIFGYTADELFGKNVNLLMPEPYRTEHDSHMKNYLRTGQSRVIGVARELPALRKSGETFSLELSLSEQFVGNQRLFTGIVRDITERKRGEKALKREMTYVQLLGDVAIAANEARSAKFAMQTAMCHICRIIEWPLGHLYFISGDSQAVVPTNNWYVSDPEKYATFMEISNKTEFVSGVGLPGRILTGGRPEWIVDVTRDINFPRARDEVSGKARDAGVRSGCAFPVVVGKETVAILEFFSPETIERDERLLEVMTRMGSQLGRVVERKRIEEELKSHRGQLERLVEERTAQLEKVHERFVRAEKLAALGKLTGSIAHEFNNPVYGIRNVLEQISERPHLEEGEKKLLALAVKECNRMTDMVRKLRGFYKPSDGIKVLLDIHLTLDDTILLMQKQLMARKIQLKKNYAPGLPKLKAVEDQMKQVFLNLLQNADNAISPEGGTITVTTESPDGNTVRISIEDTGEGISPENRTLIFDPYFSTRGIKGTGLGLSVCHGIIKSHGGDIQVESQQGKGAVFTITIPIDYSDRLGGDISQQMF